ncbi:hypothetical protein BDZ94DRAFT_1320225 [Collybia nuda]|uniref:Endopeptidase S2P n=1 Tax=Collybia nuda TaxID=64659 RepID=A0A9P5YBJ0_9AGAR|nr:hypothetical protein BDZ94DRAFT_1320225 [Collybia nuda]
MLLAHPSIALILLWVLIHGIYHSLKPSRSHSLLPFVFTPDHRRRRRFWNLSSTQVILKGIHLRVQTTAWNARHDTFTTSLRREWKVTRALKLLYDVGCLLGVLGMLAGLGALLWTCGQTLYILAQKIMANSTQSPDFVKRAVMSQAHEQSLPQEYKSFIKPIIPGMTVPLSHLPLILFAVFLAQIVHEFGHAIAAALENLPILSAGAAFTLIMPSAFVTFPTTALEVLPPRSRARIVSAGPFHNILLWIALILVQSLGIGELFWSVGYKDMSHMGRVVVKVDIGSPLYTHLPPGSIITALDDTPLGSTDAPQDVWLSYLTGLGSDQGRGLGWCSERRLERPEQCCNSELIHGLACFLSGDSKRRGCLNPVSILTDGGGNRCNLDSDCAEISTCVRPDEINKFLRLSVRRPRSDGVSEVVLWSGPLEEVWAEVHVGKLLPKFSVMPVWLPSEAQLFWQYLLMGTLSLFFFNLLPMPHLDGSQFLQNILQIAFGDGRTNAVAYDIEALEAVGDRRNSGFSGRWRDRLSRGIPHVTIGLFVLCILSGIINVLW